MSDLWQRYQDWLFHHEATGLFLDVSPMSFGEALVERRHANPDEGRMVGHYWLRQPDLAPTGEIRDQIIAGLEAIETFARDVHGGGVHPPGAQRFTDVLSIGIGGSALGPEFVVSALAGDAPPLAIHFIDNTDPAGIDRVLARLGGRLSSTLVIDTSKSGSTPEPRNGMLEGRHLAANRRAVILKGPPGRPAALTVTLRQPVSLP